MYKRGFNGIEIFSIVVVFSFIYIIGFSKASNAFEIDIDKFIYDEKIYLIEHQAEIYAEHKEDLFIEENVVYIYVKDLAESNYISTNEEGSVTLPDENESSLDNLKIKIVKNGDSIKASVIEI